MQAAYKEGIPAILCSKLTTMDECFAIQYVPGGSGYPTTSSLTARFIGKPIVDEEKREEQGGKLYEYAQALPTFLSRLAGKYTVGGASLHALLPSALGELQGGDAGLGGSSSSSSGTSSGGLLGGLAATPSSTAPGERLVLVLGEESSVIEAVLPPAKVEVDPWILDEPWSEEGVQEEEKEN